MPTASIISASVPFLSAFHLEVLVPPDCKGYIDDIVQSIPEDNPKMVLSQLLKCSSVRVGPLGKLEEAEVAYR